jgi:hypothetical protein
MKALISLELGVTYLSLTVVLTFFTAIQLSGISLRRPMEQNRIVSF